MHSLSSLRGWLHGSQRAGGSCPSPLSALSAGARTSARFSSRRSSKPLFVRPAAPVRTAAVPDRYSRGNVLSWTACSTVLSAHRGTTVLPSALKSTVHRQSTGALTLSASLCEALSSMAECAGTAAVRTALPARVASNCFAQVCDRIQLRPVHAPTVGARDAAGRVTAGWLVPLSDTV